MSSYIGENCSMNNANETRAEFNHLIAVAKNTGCAIVIIAHMNKMRDTNPLYRTKRRTGKRGLPLSSSRYGSASGGERNPME